MGRCEARIEVTKIPGGCLAVDIDAVIGAFGGGVVFKLAGVPDVHAEALSLSGSALFDPLGTGRPNEGLGRRDLGARGPLADFAATAIGS